MGQIVAFPSDRRLTPPPPAAPEPDRPEIIAVALLAMEEAPLTPPLAFGALDIAGRPFVGFRLGATALRMTVADARLAAAALLAEQAFIGCMANARVLTAAADAADAAFLRPGIV